MSQNQWQIAPFDFDAADELEWDRLVNFRKEWFREENPGDPVPPDEVIKKSLRLLPQSPLFQPVLLTASSSDGKLLGIHMIGLPRKDSPNYEAGKHMVFSDLFVLPAFRKGGVGTALLNEGVRRIDAFGGITLLQGNSISDAGDEFCLRLGAKEALRGGMNRLYRNDVDWGMVHDWIDEGRLQADGVRLETFDGLIKDDDIEEYALLYTEVYNQQPFEEIEGLEMHITPDKLREQHALTVERGQIMTTMITREPDGKISGLTEIIFNPKMAHRVLQGLTGVQVQYRGRGLGKWLKAEMLQHISAQYPDFQYIDTSNANTNAPMISINERLGFKQHKRSTLFKVDLNELKRRLPR